MDEVRSNRAVWESASQKYVRENAEMLARARSEPTLLPQEVSVLEPLVGTASTVVHLQSGNGLDDLDLARLGVRSVVGVDYSEVAATAAQARADTLGLACRYLVAEVPRVPLRDSCADLVYTGKGALIWMPDLAAWAAEVHRLLRPGGHLYVYEAHPAVPLWAWDTDQPRIRPDRGYFAASHVNDTFPAHGAVEWQWTLGEIVSTVVASGLEIRHFEEYPEPFWRPADVAAAAWDGRLPNAYSLLARRPSIPGS